MAVGQWGKPGLNQKRRCRTAQNHLQLRAEKRLETFGCRVFAVWLESQAGNGDCMNKSRMASILFRPGNQMTEEVELIHTTASAFPQGRDAHGNPVAGPSITTAIEVVSAPLDGDERLVLPEGLRSEEVRNFWTKAAVASLDLESGQDADIIRYQGSRYRAERVAKWGTDFVQVLGRRIET